MSKTLREAELNGVRCRWNPDHHCGQVWNEATQTWWTAYHFQLLDHAAVFTALRAQPYEPEPDPVVSAIYAVLEKTWDSADNTPTVAQWNGLKDEAKTLAATIRPLVLASATVEQLVDEFIRRGAIYYPATQRLGDGYPRLVLSDAECRPSAMPSTPEPTR